MQTIEAQRLAQKLLRYSDRFNPEDTREITTVPVREIVWVAESPA